MFSHHHGQFWGIPSEVRAICYGGLASPILDVARYDPRKSAWDFWQPNWSPKRNGYR